MKKEQLVQKLHKFDIRHEAAEELALREYEKYRVIQDKNYISDFDREVNKLLKGKKN